MDVKLPKFTLDKELDLRELQTKGSLLQINEIYDETDDFTHEAPKSSNKTIDLIGEPIENLQTLTQDMKPVDQEGYVKKKVLEEGGGLPLNDDCTVTIVFSGYFQNELEPFDSVTFRKPLVVDLKDNGLLPGLQIAIKSMLVNELSVFLLSYKVMYGEMGVPDRIKPKTDSVFYIKLVKSILTASIRPIDFSEPNMFTRVHKEVKLLYSSGVTLYKSANLKLAIQLFRKAESMLHKCRLADENEEKIQEKLLKKIYLNLAVCYNKTKQPLKACTACNELNRLSNLWNNGKALFLNAKALRMIGQFNEAERRLLRAMKLCPGNDEMIAEMDLLKKSRESCNQMKLIGEKILDNRKCLLTEEFKNNVESLIRNFKENPDLCKLVLPTGLNSDEMAYVKSVCIRENLFFNKLPQGSLVNIEGNDSESRIDNFLLDKEEQSIGDKSDES